MKETNSISNQPESQIEAVIKKEYGNTGGIIVQHKGRIVFEKFFNGQTRTTKNHILFGDKKHCLHVAWNCD